ncbi:hypothetical protein BH11PAT2_BH11PAT2_04990 [soil metagenome]
MATAALQPAQEKNALQIMRERYGFGDDVSNERIFRASRGIHDGYHNIDYYVSQEIAKYNATGILPYHIERGSQSDVRYNQAWVNSVREVS